MKKNIKVNISIKRILFNVLFSLMVLLCVLNTTNPDYPRYEIDYIAYGTGNSLRLIRGHELLYVVSNILCYRLGLSFYQFHILFYVIVFFIYRKAILDYSKKPLTVLICFAIYPFLVFAVQMRNAMGVAIVMYGVRFLTRDSKKGNIYYLITVIIATMFHTSCIAYLVLFCVNVKDFRKFYKYLLIGETIFIYVFFPSVLRILYQLTNNRRFFVYNVGIPMFVVVKHTLPIVFIVIILLYCLPKKEDILDEKTLFNTLMIKMSLLVCSLIIFIKEDINFSRLVYFMFPLMMLTITNVSAIRGRRMVANDNYYLRGLCYAISVAYCFLLLSPFQQDTFNNVTLAFFPWLR